MYKKLFLIFSLIILFCSEGRADLLEYEDWKINEDTYRPSPILFLHGFASGDDRTWKEKDNIIVNADERLEKYFEDYYTPRDADGNVIVALAEAYGHERSRYRYLEIISFIDHWDASTQELVDRNSSVDTFQDGDYYVQKGYRSDGDKGWADKLDEAIEALVNTYQTDKIVLVSHSMGGLAAREFLTNSKYSTYNDNINRLVTIDTPHLGSPLAKLANGLTKSQKIGWFIPGLGWLFSITVEILDQGIELNSQIDIDGDAVNDMDLSASGSGFLDALNSRVHPQGVDFYVIYGKANEFTNWLMFGDYEGGDGVVSLNSQRGIKDAQGNRVFELTDEIEIAASHGQGPKVASETDSILKFIDSTTPEVQITSPYSGEVFNTSTITVEGTINNEYLPADCKFIVSVMRDEDGMQVFNQTYTNRVCPFENSDPAPAGFKEEGISLEDYDGNLKSGTYTIKATVENPAGIMSNTAEVNIKLSLEPPIITDENPISIIADTTPTIQARIYSPEGIDIDLTTVQMVLDSSIVTHSIEPEIGGQDIIVSYTPTADLAKDVPSTTDQNEGLHTVTINASDVNGLVAEQKEWNFTIRDTPWPMFHHDPKHTGQSPYLGAQTNTLKWRYQTGKGVNSSPAIASDGTIYVGSYDNYLYAIGE